MIYLLRMAYLDVKNKTTHTILKFGYTDNYEGRLRQYQDYQMGVEELKIYEGGTFEDEARLKIYFRRQKLIQYRAEWLYDREEVLDLFNSWKTIDDIRNFLDKNKIIYAPSHSKVQPVDTKLINFVASKIGNTQELWDNILELLKFIDVKDHISILCSKYNLDQEEFQEYLNNDNIISSESIKSFVSKFNELTVATDKLKFLVSFIESDDVSKNDIEALFDYIPFKYRVYYEFGVDRIKACGYQIGKIQREIEVNISNCKLMNDIKSCIYDEFIVGKRYTNPYIKTKLKELYKTLGYKKAARAIDIEQYFHIKKVYITSLGKHGYEIVAKIDQ